MFSTHSRLATPTSQLKIRSGIKAGDFYGCNAYCQQEFDRCRVNGTPVETCNDRLPVCQNACSVCGLYY